MESKRQFSSQITFLNFEDYEGGKKFLGEILGLEPVYDIGWAAVYAVAEGAYLGAVSTEKKMPGAKPGSLVSLTTEDAEQWHREISEKWKGNITLVRKVAGAGLKSFFIEGPEGFQFEIQQFMDPELQKLF